MIKATGTGRNGSRVIFLGLSKENCRRLLEDQPIVVNGGEIGFPGIEIVLIGGETEDGILHVLGEHGALPARPTP
jgi:hypothetical protein